MLERAKHPQKAETTQAIGFTVDLLSNELRLDELED
jgi:hypothetical protein